MPDQSTQTTDGAQRNVRIFWLALLGLLLFFSVSYTGRLLERAHMLAQVAQWEQRIDAAKARQADLIAQRNFVRSDAYVAWVAREQLGLAQEHDKVVIVVADETVSSAAVNEVSSAGQDRRADVGSAREASPPRWRQWLAQLMGSSAHASIPER